MNERTWRGGVGMVMMLVMAGWCGGGVGWAAAAGRGAVVELGMNRDTRDLEVVYKGRLLLAYRSQPGPYKPYVRDLRSLGGVSVLLDGPSDHLHHHGLMYAVKVNGVNYWEEVDGSGYQMADVEVTRSAGRQGEGKPMASFSQRIFWVPAKLKPAEWAGAAVLVEQRKIRVMVDEMAGEVALEWESGFVPGPGQAKVVLSGAAYHGLGLRLAREFDGTGRRQNSAGTAYSAEAAWDVKAASWESITQSVQGRDVTVAMFSEPGNAGESRFFSMLNGFAYVSATQGLDVKPIEVEAGRPFRLRYLVTVRDSAQAAEALEARKVQWLESQRLRR